MADRHSEEGEEAVAPYAALVTQPIADLDRWKAGWDAHESARCDAGLLGHLIHRSEDDPQTVTVLLPLADLERAQAFARSCERAQEVARYGMLGPADVRWLRVLRSALVWDRQLPSVILRGPVDDVDAWLAIDDGDGPRREAAGIVGHAAARSLDDPHLAIRHLQAESFTALRAFLADPEAGPAMAAHGGTGASDVRFHTSGWAKTYPPQPDTRPLRAESAKEEIRLS